MKHGSRTKRLFSLSYTPGSNLSPYPNAYLLPYNIQSETDYDESERGRPSPGGGGGVGRLPRSRVANKPMNSDMSQQIIDSAAEDGATTGQEDEEEDDDDGIPSYGFPSQPSRSKNRCETTDIDQLISDGGKIGVNFLLALCSGW